MKEEWIKNIQKDLEYSKGVGFIMVGDCNYLIDILNY
jgi:hypothetical protein